MKFVKWTVAVLAAVLLAAAPAAAATGNPASLSQVSAVFGPPTATHITKADSWTDISCSAPYHPNIYIFWPDGSGYATPYTDADGNQWWWRDGWANGVKVTPWHRVRNYTTRDVMAGIWCVTS